MNHRIISAALVLALASLACNFGFPDRVGPDVTDEITVAGPGGDETRLFLTFAAGELHLQPGASRNLVEGTATYNIEDLKPVIDEDGDDVTIRQGDYQF